MRCPSIDRFFRHKHAVCPSLLQLFTITKNFPKTSFDEFFESRYDDYVKSPAGFQVFLCVFKQDLIELLAWFCRQVGSDDIKLYIPCSVRPSVERLRS